jgi:hypothetical protein
VAQLLERPASAPADQPGVVRLFLSGRPQPGRPRVRLAELLLAPTCVVVECLPKDLADQTALVTIAPTVRGIRP